MHLNSIFSKSFYLGVLMTAARLIALRRPWSQVIGGTVKATMGVLIFVAGAVTVINALAPLGTLLLGATGARGVGPTNEAILGLAQSRYGSVTALSYCVGILGQP